MDFHDKYVPLPSAIIISSISSAVVVICWQLMLPPVVGLANNGDFGKVLGNFGLQAPPEHLRDFADTKYDFHFRYFYKSHYFSSELILVGPALALNAIFSSDGSFDLRYIGVIHGGLFLLAIVLFVPLIEDLKPLARYALGFVVLFVFADVAYVSYLNSFYMDVAAYLFLLLATVLYLRGLRWRRRLDWTSVDRTLSGDSSSPKVAACHALPVLAQQFVNHNAARRRHVERVLYA